MTRPFFATEDFLSEFWQKKPCVFKGSLTHLASPVAIDDLMELTSEELVESRVISGSVEKQDWSLQHGPFAPEDLGQLPNKPWTLLVQGLDQWDQATADILDLFRFIPSWRLDDVMASYAVKGGSVGPHFDYYDVFLIQMSGKRLWKLGQLCTDKDELIDHPDIKILNEFHENQSWLMEPGDVLYIPPGIAHFGVAQDNECMTYSVGFRAPSEAEILEDYSAWMAQQLSGNLRYSDPDLLLSTNAGEITEDVGKRLQSLLQKHLSSKENMSRWFASYMTEPKYPELIEPALEEIPDFSSENIGDQEIFRRNESFRFAYYKNCLYINGEEFELSEETMVLAKLVANHNELHGAQIKPFLERSANKTFFNQLIQFNALYLKAF